MNNNYQKKIRIAKFLSSKGYGSRREIEQLIQKNKIIVNKEIISSPITFVSNEDEIIINNKKINLEKKLDVWKFYKPLNIKILLICSIFHKLKTIIISLLSIVI